MRLTSFSQSFKKKSEQITFKGGKKENLTCDLLWSSAPKDRRVFLHLIDCLLALLCDALIVLASVMLASTNKSIKVSTNGDVKTQQQQQPYRFQFDWPCANIFAFSASSSAVSSPKSGITSSSSFTCTGAAAVPSFSRFSASSFSRSSFALVHSRRLRKAAVSLSSRA